MASSYAANNKDKIKGNIFLVDKQRRPTGYSSKSDFRLHTGEIQRMMF